MTMLVHSDLPESITSLCVGCIVRIKLPYRQKLVEDGSWIELSSDVVEMFVTHLRHGSAFPMGPALRVKFLNLSRWTQQARQASLHKCPSSLIDMLSVE